jgi:TonB family protein
MLVAGVYLRADTPGQDPAAPVRVGGNIQAPKKIKDVKPVYPIEAQTAGVQGIVVLEVTVGANGRVTEARPLRSIPLLDEAAIDAVRQWEFTPTLVNGVPVPVVMSVTVNFTLDDALATGAADAPGAVSAPAPSSTGVSPCQTTSETTAQVVRRQAAIRFLEDVHAKQRIVFLDRQGKSYAPLEQLPGLVPAPGFEVQLVANEHAYSVSLKDATDPCQPVFFSDQKRVIYMAVPVR